MPEEGFLGQLFSSALLSWDFQRKTPVLNTEELATIYHLPTHEVLTSPMIERVESKTLGAPAGLPIFDQDEESLPFETSN